MNTTLEAPRERQLLHVRNALYSQPWAITEKSLAAMIEIFELNAAGTPPAFEARVNAAGSPPMAATQVADELPFDLVNDVAIISISGPIFPKANLMTRLSGATSLEELASDLKQAVALAPNAIIFNIDSPGGSVMGLHEFADMLYLLAADSAFPIVALANGQCASAAYLIASQCNAVFATNGSMVGSIGTLAQFSSSDRAQKNAGVDSIVLRSSELKAAGAGPITPNQQDSLQKIVMTYFAMFKEAVIRGRPGIDIESVATGEVWIGQDAQRMGLADGITTLPALIADYGPS